MSKKDLKIVEDFAITLNRAAEEASASMAVYAEIPRQECQKVARAIQRLVAAIEAGKFPGSSQGRSRNEKTR